MTALRNPLSHKIYYCFSWIYVKPELWTMSVNKIQIPSSLNTVERWTSTSGQTTMKLDLASVDRTQRLRRCDENSVTRN